MIGDIGRGLFGQYRRKFSELRYVLETPTVQADRAFLWLDLVLSATLVMVFAQSPQLWVAIGLSANRVIRFLIVGRLLRVQQIGTHASFSLYNLFGLIMAFEAVLLLAAAILTDTPAEALSVALLTLGSLLYPYPIPWQAEQSEP